MLLVKLKVIVFFMVSGILSLKETERCGCSDRYPKCKEGKNQSPIDIREEDVIHKNLGPIVFENYNSTSLALRVTNYGEYVLAIVEIRYGQVYLSGGGLPGDRYQLLQFHFHWGNDSSEGSEHTYEGRPYPAELHFIHYNLKYSRNEAVNKEPDGLAALVVFIEVGSEDNPAFEEVLNGISRVTKAGSKQVINPVRLDTLLPNNNQTFYRYHGSLSTPAFQESVQWILLKTPIYLSENQLMIFRTLQDKNGLLGQNTGREPQPLHGRAVYYNGGSKSHKNHEEF